MSESKNVTPINTNVTTFDPAKWAERLRADATEQRKAERTSAAFFSIKSGVLSFAGTPIPGNAMNTVVLESIHERTWYPQKYGTGENTSPACYAMVRDGKYTVPNPESSAPQAKSCDECQWNKWGSSDNGKGKACREGRRLALLSADDLSTPEKVLAGTVAYLRIPVTSAKGFGNFVQGVVGSTDLPLFCHVTQVKVVPDAKTQVKVLFEHVRGITDNAVLETVVNRAQAEKENIFFPYPKPEGSTEAALTKPPAKPRKF